MTQPYPALTVDDLALFSGRPAASYENVEYLPVAIDSAVLLFKLATCLTALPDDPTQYQLARFAILAMADDLYLHQPNAEALASPFNSESIGSYSYSKVGSGSARAMNAAVVKGEETGVMWFDLAVDKIGACDTFDGFEMSGGIDVWSNDRLHVNPSRSRYLTFLGADERDRYLSFFGPSAAEVWG